MCGIAGYYYKRGLNIETNATVLKMLEAQRHRGPDDSGVHAFSLRSQKTEAFFNTEAKRVSNEFDGIIGFNRLSILDLSKNAHQPMSTSDGKVILAFNGEIYNAFDFKEELHADGYRFKSTSDTEIILNLYLKYGFDGMIKRLNGMFAIVLVDTEKKQLFIARDRFGIKPLYVYETPDVLAFSSEIKSFLALPDFQAQLDTNLLDEFLLFRTTINSTLFKGVVNLEPGTYRVYSPGGAHSTRFFDLNEYQRAGKDSKFELTDLKSALNESVKRQLLSDVKLGCQLSGGIDSSLVTSFANQIKQDDLLETISITFDNASFNEESYIDQVSEKLNIKAHKFRLHPAYYLEHFEKATWHFEAPLNHPNTIGIYLLSQHAKQFVTVLLSGEGADEVFGGYDRYATAVHPLRLGTLLNALKSNKSNLQNFLLNYLSQHYRSIMGAAYMTPSIALQLKSNFNFNKAIESRKTVYSSLKGTTFDKQVKYELLTFLPDLLMRQDKMSMAHSIENRVPFLDNELVQKSFLIHQDKLMGKVRGKEQLKLALKLLTAQIFGDDFAFRKKAGFGIPLRDFFSDTHFKAYILDQLLPSISQRGIFNFTKIEKWTKNINAVSSHELDALWIMISFEAWAKKFKV